MPSTNQAWHDSPEGRAWHKAHFERFANRLREKKFPLNCPQCGKTGFTSQNARFCSKPCGEAWRQKRWKKARYFNCQICGEGFFTLSYKSDAARRTCSNPCAYKLRAQSLKRSRLGKRPNNGKHMQMRKVAGKQP